VIERKIDIVNQTTGTMQATPQSPDAAAPGLRFQELPLQAELLRGVEALGFTACTPIQTEALQLLLQGRDVAGQAQTGTGKTAAFLLATMHHLLQAAPPAAAAGRPRAVIIAPTRELAVQIHSDALALGRFTDVRVVLVHGGVDYEGQRAALRDGVDVLVGTPGRLIDYHQRRELDLRKVQAVVLDEADRMFDLGFIRDIRYLLRRMPPPPQRLGMLFSATLPWRVLELAYEHMNDPELIRVNPEKVTVDGVSQQLYHVAKEDKLPLLVGLLRSINPQRTIIFVNTRRTADRLRECLQANGFDIAILTGDIPQAKRLRLFKKFTAGELPLLVATDLAARGLHVPEVSHVFNYDLPFNAEDYVHRIGRTARAGATGDAVSLACDEYVYSLMDIETLLGYKIPVASFPAEMLVPVEQPPAARRRPRPRGGPGGPGGAGGKSAGGGRRGRRRPRSG